MIFLISKIFLDINFYGSMVFYEELQDLGSQVVHSGASYRQIDLTPVVILGNKFMPS
jgi:hypothetical protein